MKPFARPCSASRARLSGKTLIISLLTLGLIGGSPVFALTDRRSQPYLQIFPAMGLRFAPPPPDRSLIAIAAAPPEPDGTPGEVAHQNAVAAQTKVFAQITPPVALPSPSIPEIVQVDPNPVLPQPAPTPEPQPQPKSRGIPIIREEIYDVPPTEEVLRFFRPDSSGAPASRASYRLVP